MLLEQTLLQKNCLFATERFAVASVFSQSQMLNLPCIQTYIMAISKIAKIEAVIV